MKKCSICGRAIPEAGWGQFAYCTDDGTAYIHHQCRPAAPSPPPEPITTAPGDTHSPPSEFLTLTDAAALLGLHPSTLRRRIKNRTLPAFRLDGGQTVLIERAALLKLLHRL